MSEPTDCIAVETNWLLDVALRQSSESEELLAYAEQGRLRLVMPSFCVAEAIKRFEQLRKGWIEQQATLKKHRYEVQKSPHLEFAGTSFNDAHLALAQVTDIAEAEFWRTLDRVCKSFICWI